MSIWSLNGCLGESGFQLLARVVMAMSPGWSLAMAKAGYETVRYGIQTWSVKRGIIGMSIWWQTELLSGWRVPTHGKRWHGHDPWRYLHFESCQPKCGSVGPEQHKIDKYSLTCLEVKCTVTDVAFVKQRQHSQIEVWKSDNANQYYFFPCVHDLNQYQIGQLWTIHVRNNAPAFLELLNFTLRRSWGVIIETVGCGGKILEHITICCSRY